MMELMKQPVLVVGVFFLIQSQMDVTGAEGVPKPLLENVDAR